MGYHLAIQPKQFKSLTTCDLDGQKCDTCWNVTPKISTCCIQSINVLSVFTFVSLFDYSVFIFVLLFDYYVFTCVLLFDYYCINFIYQFLILYLTFYLWHFFLIYVAVETLYLSKTLETYSNYSDVTMLLTMLASPERKNCGKKLGYMARDNSYWFRYWLW